MRMLVNLLLTIALTVPLSGCLALAAGATAGGMGAYYGTKEARKAKEQDERVIARASAERAQGRFEEDQRRGFIQDERLTHDITNKFLGGGLTKVLSVHVTVKDGVATLYGNVPAEAVVQRAIGIAHDTPGIKQVVSHLVVVEVEIREASHIKVPRPLPPPAQGTITSELPPGAVPLTLPPPNAIKLEDMPPPGARRIAPPPPAVGEAPPPMPRPTREMQPLPWKK